MKHREQLVGYIHANVDPQYDPDQDLLIQLLDSVSLLQLIGFIDQELGIQLELSNLTLDAFATMESLLTTLSAYAPEQASEPEALTGE